MYKKFFKRPLHLFATAPALIMLSTLSSCGGGGGGSDPVIAAVGEPQATTNRCKNVPGQPIPTQEDGFPGPDLNIAGEWVLQPQLSDEFDGTSVDTNKWSFQTGLGGGWGNSELQNYRAENAKVANGQLIITGTKSGSNYFSARMRSIEKMSFTYGRVEAQIQAPAGLGLWPAFWMLPDDSPYIAEDAEGNGWGGTGEIDIFEAFNPGAGDDVFGSDESGGTIWHGMLFPSQQSRGAVVKNDATQPHTYAIEWEANQIRWYLDGEHYQTIGADHYYSYYWGGQDTGYVRAAPGAPYDTNFHILLNLAIGGNGPANSPDNSNVWPAEMKVDFVRVFKCMVNGEESPTGAGCAGTLDAGGLMTGSNTINPDVEMPAAKDAFVASQMLFDSGVNDLLFCDGLNPLAHEINLTVIDPDGVVSVNAAATASDNSDGHGNVLDIVVTETSEPAGFAFEPTQPDQIPNCDDDELTDNPDCLPVKSLTLVGMGDDGQGNAELKMDIYIDSANTELGTAENPATFSIFMEDTAALLAESAPSDDRCAATGISSKEIAFDELPHDQWTTLSVQLNEIAPGLKADEVTKLFGLMVEGKAHIQLDNVEIICANPSEDGCGIAPPAANDFGDAFVVFGPYEATAKYEAGDGVPPIWTNGIRAWDTTIQTDYIDGETDNHVRWREVFADGLDADGAPRAKVLEVEFADDGKNTDGLFYIQSNVTNDLRSYIAGKLVFDMRVTEGDTTDFTWKIDCRYPCGTGDQTLLGVEPDGEWQTFEILVSEAILKGLDIGKVNTPLVLFPSFGTPGQQGTTIQLDNIKWTIDGGEPPPPPPPLGSQPPTFAPAGTEIVYESTPAAPWTFFNCCGGGAIQEDVVANDPDYPGYGDVLQLSYTTNQGTVTGLNTLPLNVGIDISSYAGGSLEFDAKIVSNPDSCAPWLMKVEGPGVELPLSAGLGGVNKPEGQWAHYSFKLEGPLAGLNKTRWDKLMIFPRWQSAQGGVIQIDNIHIAPAPPPAP